MLHFKIIVLKIFIMSKGVMPLKDFDFIKLIILSIFRITRFINGNFENVV